MGAGLSQVQIYRRVYSRLQAIKRELAAAGIKSRYASGQLFGDNFNLGYHIIRASNAEVAGGLYVNIIGPDVAVPERFKPQYWGPEYAGIERIKELFGSAKVGPVNDGTGLTANLPAGA